MTDLQSAEYYGNLSKVAANFAIATGSPTEELAAYLYAKIAAHHAKAVKPPVFKVQIGYSHSGRNRWRRFPTLDAASACCAGYFQTSGVVLAIEESTR